MRVTDARLIRLRDFCQFEAWVTLESVQTDPFLLWYRFPLDYMTAVNTGLNDAFVAALLTPAMALGERLRIEGVVSGQLMQSLPRLQAIYQEWNEGLSIISVESSGLDHSDAPEGRASRVSLFFSLGIDSFYSLLKNHRDHPGDEKTIDHLLFVRGFDIAIDDPKVDDLFGMPRRWPISLARRYSLPRPIFVILRIDSSIGARPVTERHWPASRWRSAKD